MRQRLYLSRWDESSSAEHKSQVCSRITPDVQTVRWPGQKCGNPWAMAADCTITVNDDADSRSSLSPGWSIAPIAADHRYDIAEAQRSEAEASAHATVK